MRHPATANAHPVTPLSVTLVATASHSTSVVALTGDRLLEAVLGCTAAAAAGQLVTSRWAVRHRRHAVADVLRAAADLLDQPSPHQLDALRRAGTRLDLVSARTAGERRAVRLAVARLDELGEAARLLAERLPADWSPRTADPDATATSHALREMAATLSARDGRPTSPSPALDDLPTRLAELGLMPGAVKGAS
ncbi:hypothetical protein SAMN05216267_103188 [Actinacidiphila rubida]|uniref:Uncharacterized protein n=1 Tax=Actinacidiphila rubida TaxID=310780 RepID=A0A1H8QX16_9ACTN|nr:hypothetical protein SAMN05216267_103188 [Actinacidiphila rubida]